jgi:RimJ/RimL family protein N-acetyltransferase
MTILYRVANLADSDLVLNWRNDPIVRKNSRDISIVSAETHNSWFAARIRKCGAEPIFIFSQNNREIGFTRLDLIDPEIGKFEVSIAVGSEMRGKGYGSIILSMTVDAARQMTNAHEIIGNVRSDNYVSRKLFESAGFSTSTSSGDFVSFFLNL